MGPEDYSAGMNWADALMCLAIGIAAVSLAANWFLWKLTKHVARQLFSLEAAWKAQPGLPWPPNGARLDPETRDLIWDET